MKVTKVVEVQDLSAISLRIAKQTLTRLMYEVALPEAVKNAPGVNLPSRIELGPIRVVGNGKYRVALRFPGKYGPVEYGSGQFVGEPARRIKSKRWKALHLPYGYFKSVMWVGQPAQPFATPALEKVAKMFPAEFANDLNAAISSRRRSSPQARRGSSSSGG